ncbi:hypothetical protein [Variovorax sp. RB3P1]
MSKYRMQLIQRGNTPSALDGFTDDCCCSFYSASTVYKGINHFRPLLRAK